MYVYGIAMLLRPLQVYTKFICKKWSSKFVDQDQKPVQLCNGIA